MDTVIKLSELTLDEGLPSLLQKGLNYAVTQRAIPMEDILTGVEKAENSLPVEKGKEARKETVRIIKNVRNTQGKPNKRRDGSSTKPAPKHETHHLTRR
jgi:hypothetical protein